MSNTRKAAKRAVANMNAARNFPVGTCPASRHVAVMAETLAKGKTYYMLTQEPDHCAESMATIVGALWECRAERNALAEENERLRKRVKDMSSDIRIGYIHCEALAEIKATVDGKSDQPVADIISSCIAAVAAYRAILAELKGQNDE
jgi:hypothetical protein